MACINVAKEMTLCDKVPIYDKVVFKNVGRTLNVLKNFVDELQINSLSDHPHFPRVRLSLLQYMANIISKTFDCCFNVDDLMKDNLESFPNNSIYLNTESCKRVIEKRDPEYKSPYDSSKTTRAVRTRKNALKKKQQEKESKDKSIISIQPTLKRKNDITIRVKDVLEEFENDSDNEVIKITPKQQDKQPIKKRRLMKVKDTKEPPKKADVKSSEFVPVIQEFNPNIISPLEQSPILSQQSAASDFTEPDIELQFDTLIEQQEEKFAQEKAKEVEEQFKRQLKEAEEKKRKEEEEKIKQEKEERERIIRIQKEAAEKKIIEEVLNTTIRTVEEQDTMEKEESRQRLIIYLEKKKELDRMQQLYNINI